MKTVSVSSLVGQNLTGIVANITNPIYRYQYSDGVGNIRKLKEVYWKKEKGFRWLMLTWEKEPIHTAPMVDCGYAGHREDGDWQEWTIDLLD